MPVHSVASTDVMACCLAPSTASLRLPLRMATRSRAQGAQLRWVAHSPPPPARLAGRSPPVLARLALSRCLATKPNQQRADEPSVLELKHALALLSTSALAAPAAALAEEGEATAEAVASSVPDLLFGLTPLGVALVLSPAIFYGVFNIYRKQVRLPVGLPPHMEGGRHGMEGVGSVHCGMHACPCSVRTLSAEPTSCSTDQPWSKVWRRRVLLCGADHFRQHLLRFCLPCEAVLSRGRARRAEAALAQTFFRFFFIMQRQDHPLDSSIV